MSAMSGRRFSASLKTGTTTDNAGASGDSVAGSSVRRSAAIARGREEKSHDARCQGLLHGLIPRAKVFPGPRVASPAYDSADAAPLGRPVNEPVDGAGLRCFESEPPTPFADPSLLRGAAARVGTAWR